jgi:hypothetical protein
MCVTVLMHRKEGVPVWVEYEVGGERMLAVGVR